MRYQPWISYILTWRSEGFLWTVEWLAWILSAVWGGGANLTEHLLGRDGVNYTNRQLLSTMAAPVIHR